MDRETLQEVKNFRRNLPLETLYESYVRGEMCETMEAYLELTPGQSYGPKAENWYRDMTKSEKIPASKEMGDFRCQTSGRCGEYKFSYAKEDKKRKFNFVQIRPWHNIIGYALEVYVEQEGFYIFNIGKNNMNLLLKEYGGLAHGVKKSVQIDEQKEYALRGIVDGTLWNDLKKYHDPSLFAIREAKNYAS
jgi:hypothetical protein